MLGNSRKRTLDSVKYISDYSGAEGGEHRAAGSIDRLTGLEPGRLLIDLNGGELLIKAYDLADKTLLADIDHLHHAQSRLALYRNDGAVYSVYNIIFRQAVHLRPLKYY